MPLQTLLALLPSSLAQLYDTSNSITALTGTANLINSSSIGNYYNHWTVNANNTIYDLTRSSRMPTTSPKTLPMIGKRETAIIEPSRTAFVIVDMQNFFLHPSLSPSADLGRAAVTPTLDMIKAFRENGMPVLWVNWGLVDFDLVTLPPSLLEGFSDDGTMATTFGSDMGSIEAKDGGKVAVGRKLMRGEWNSQPYGPLGGAMEEGVANGTDFYFNKNRLSGLWGAQTPLGLYLQEHEITTLFLGGVNSDQCVWSTLIDAYFKGFDVVYVEDCAGTTSPRYAEQMVRYNGDSDGFLANSTGILEALAEQR